MPARPDDVEQARIIRVELDALLADAENIDEENFRERLNDLSDKARGEADWKAADEDPAPGQRPAEPEQPPQPEEPPPEGQTEEPPPNPEQPPETPAEGTPEAPGQQPTEPLPTGPGQHKQQEQQQQAKKKEPKEEDKEEPGGWEDPCKEGGEAPPAPGGVGQQPTNLPNPEDFKPKTGQDDKPDNVA